MISCRHQVYTRKGIATYECLCRISESDWLLGFPSTILLGAFLVYIHAYPFSIRIASTLARFIAFADRVSG